MGEPLEGGAVRRTATQARGRTNPVYFTGSGSGSLSVSASPAGATGVLTESRSSWATSTADLWFSRPGRSSVRPRPPHRPLWARTRRSSWLGITNAASEGHNRVIKLTSRCAYAGSAAPMRTRLPQPRSRLMSHFTVCSEGAWRAGLWPRSR